MTITLESGDEPTSEQLKKLQDSLLNKLKFKGWKITSPIIETKQETSKTPVTDSVNRGLDKQEK